MVGFADCGGSEGIAACGGRREDTRFNMLEVGQVDVLTGTLMQVEHTIVDIRELGKDCMDFFLILVISSEGKIFLCRASSPTRRLLKKCLVIFILFNFKTILNTLSGLD